MKQIIDINNWNRKEHYNFFKDYQEPYFGITANVDCTKAYKFAKDNNISFFIYYMFKSLMAVNVIEEFRFRIEGSDIVIYDEIHCSTTVLNSNNLFAFAFMPYTNQFETFYPQASQEISKVKTLTHMNLTDNSARSDVIHYSTIPWISFTCITQERNFAKPDSVPKINFGKYSKEGGRLLLPLSVHVHHGLMDGIHVGEYFELFQQLLNESKI